MGENPAHKVRQIIRDIYSFVAGDVPCSAETRRSDLGFAATTMENVVSCHIKTNPYLTGDTLLLRYRVQPVNAM
jgi:hypothetical protein